MVPYITGVIFIPLFSWNHRRREPEECEHSGNGICEEEEEEEEEEECLLCSIVLKRKQHSIPKHRAPDPLLWNVTPSQFVLHKTQLHFTYSRLNHECFQETDTIWRTSYESKINIQV